MRRALWPPAGSIDRMVRALPGEYLRADRSWGRPLTRAAAGWRANGAVSSMLPSRITSTTTRSRRSRRPRRTTPCEWVAAVEQRLLETRFERHWCGYGLRVTALLCTVTRRRMAANQRSPTTCASMSCRRSSATGPNSWREEASVELDDPGGKLKSDRCADCGSYLDTAVHHRSRSRWTRSSPSGPPTWRPRRPTACFDPMARGNRRRSSAGSGTMKLSQARSSSGRPKTSSALIESARSTRSTLRSVAAARPSADADYGKLREAVIRLYGLRSCTPATAFLDLTSAVGCPERAGAVRSAKHRRRLSAAPARVRRGNSWFAAPPPG